MKTMNEMNVLELFVYKDEKFRWVFDDEEHNLAQEAFVAGMDTVIDILTEGFPDHGYDGFIFCMCEFVGTNDYKFLCLTHSQALHHTLLGQSNYYDVECVDGNRLGFRAWLCNNLYRYIDHTPQVICCWAKPKP